MNVMSYGQLKFIRDINASLGQAFNIPKGNYSYLYLESTCLELALNEVALSAGVAVVLRLNGRQIFSSDINILVDIDNILWGMPTMACASIDTNDHACEIALVIPFEFPGIPNALDIDKRDNFWLEWREGNIIAGTLSVYGVESPFTPENYIPVFDKLSETGAGRQVFRISGQNNYIHFLQARDTGDMLSVRKDGEAVYHCYVVELLRFTEIMNRIEAGTLATALIHLAPSYTVTDVLSDNVEVEIHHAVAGTSTLYVYTLDFDVDRIDTSGDKQVLKSEGKVNVIASTKPEVRKIVPVPSKQVVVDRGVRNLTGGSNRVRSPYSPLL